MGIMIDGTWDAERDQLTDESGAFTRQPSVFRERIEPGGDHPPAPNRYHLYISRACPWAHRTMIVRAVKGLEEVISVDIVDPVRENDGWIFSPEKEDCTPDSVHGADFLREVYAMADTSYTGRVTVPVLWDREEETIVNNESSEIIQILDSAFDHYATRDVRLFPEDLPVTETIEEIYEPINNGVYRAGFATVQSAYQTAVTELFEALDRWEGHLETHRFLCGETFSAADICLFPTLYRFDEIYQTHFKCNQSPLTNYTNLWDHTREIYQLPGVAETCNMNHCKAHYYRSHRDINPTGIVPVGPAPDFSQPHDRDRLNGDLPSDLQHHE